MLKEKKLVNDELDLVSVISVLFDNFNFILSIFLSSILVIGIYYLSATRFYQSNSLLEIKESNSSTYLPESFTREISSGASQLDTLKAEIEIYRSNDTILDALENFKKLYKANSFPSLDDIRSNLSLQSKSKSLVSISYTFTDKELTPIILTLLNEEFIKDRRNFIRQSSAAGKNFIQQEIPRIKLLLKEAEDNLNSFKVSTNTSDVIFNSNSRNQKLDRLRTRVDEIAFKELELKEFYKENHPIYLTLSEQKKLVLSQIESIEADLPNIPKTERTLENFKREVEIYSNVLRELSSQELSLGMSEASSLSNVRIINEASLASRISPRFFIFFISILFTALVYFIFLMRHFIGDKITNLDALNDYVGKEKIIGEFPLIDFKKEDTSYLSNNIADELINKTIYEITHSNNDNDNNSYSIIGSRKDVGKSEISKRLFNKLKERYKVCIIDLDYRKKGLTREIIGKTDFKNFDEFSLQINNFYDENGSLFIPSFDVEDPPSFFTSDEFVEEIKKLKDKFDFVLCDTPPWNLFVDAKIISKLFDNHIYIVCNQLSTFKDINSVSQDIEDKDSLKFFYNKFNLYFNFLWYKYQYPYYSRNYYYDYSSYSAIRKNFTFTNFLVESIPNSLFKLKKWIKSFLNL